MRLDRRADALAGGMHGPAWVAGNSRGSRLVQLITGNGDDGLVMPPEGMRLTAGEVATLSAWIDQGAVWPPQWSASTRADAAGHWAFQRPRKARPPAVRRAGWVRNPIDAFVLARLEREGIEPAPQADRATLIRRLSLDLLGLPPTPEEVTRFVADEAPNAYEELVERLLASPHFGERWGRHWLDLARYADSSGYEFDTPRSVWRYRDWVVDALNRDLPFDQFVVEQIAGDLLPGAGTEQVIASGFHCNAMLDPNLRHEAVLDRVNTTGTVFLGLTVGCAQCHSHKFDPLTQQEYFQLYAFFDSADVYDLELASPAEKQARDAAQARVDAAKRQRTEHENELKRTLAEWVAALGPDERAKLPEATAALATTAGEQSGDQVAKLLAAREAADERYQELSREVDSLAKQVPTLPTTLAMRSQPRETRLFVRGNFERPGDAVAAGVPRFLHPMAAEKPTRLDLARWLVAAENPLVARVTVNRFWQHYFGSGLVETANDFGVQTPAPSHQELLDWLACEFVDRGWSMKAIHRLIVTSATYRQSSAARSDLQAIDPQNRLLARQRRLRVEAEVVRDLALSASGLLSERIGGPSVFPDQPAGVLDDRATKATWTTSPGADRYRRGLYTWIWRLTPHPMLALFDAPDASMACTRRDRSNTPVQALTMLNDPTFVESARGLARKVLAAQGDARARLDRAFAICFGRPPSEREAKVLLELLGRELAELHARAEDAGKIAGPGDAADAEPLAAWTVVCRALLGLDEFVTRE